jgi:Fe2+ transport system protein B
MDGIEGWWAFGEWVRVMPDGVLRSLLVDGVIAGTGAVLVFLPQILILFFFILVLEDSGYLPRAAFLLDRIMGTVGLSGRSFIPLLSSFACAVPGIMATRSISSWRDRLLTIMIAPLMTCSARLPVYALLIAAFIPSRPWPASSICRAWCCLRCMWAASSVPWPWPGWPSWPAPSNPHAADDGAAFLPLAQPAQPGAGPV